jgi:hypothetical protein
MRQYLLSTYQPDGPPPPSVDLEQVTRKVTAFANELREAGAWVFASHLDFATAPTVVRFQNGEELTTEGPYVDGREHLGGITVIQAEDHDAALVWAKKLAEATGLPIEVQPFMEMQAGLE